MNFAFTINIICPVTEGDALGSQNPTPQENGDAASSSFPHNMASRSVLATDNFVGVLCGLHFKQQITVN